MNSAPGKLMLLGEHAVVYGFPCLVTAVDERMSVIVEPTNSGKIEIISELGPRSPFIETAIEKSCQYWKIENQGWRITVAQAFSCKFGFGSSSAVTVATLAAIFESCGLVVSERELFEVAYDVVKTVQGVASGFDVAAAVYGGTVWYEKLGQTITSVAFIEKDVRLIVGYTGIKADTVPLIKHVRELYESDTEKIKAIFDQIEQLVFQAKGALEKSDWNILGQAMTANHRLLQQLDVSTERLDQMVEGAIASGAHGAKLSGAGGGDCMIALVPEDKISAVTQAIILAGGSVLSVAINAPGATRVISDNEQEEFIVVDSDDEIVGHKTRQECHRDKTLIHRSVNVLLTDPQGRILLQKRSQTKDLFPRFWTLSATGHVSKGETYDQAAKRELTEETTLTTDLVFHTKHLSYYPEETEYWSLYTGQTSSALPPANQEVEEFRFFSKDELKDGVNNGTIQLTNCASECLQLLKYL